MIRLNDNGRHPNPLIYFIKPLSKTSSSDVELATQTLNRVAAIVFPIMKEHGLIVKSLAEHEYNNQFLGRNWNAGEVVELVLKDSRGQWLPETFVLSVLLHELSHCTNMHHGRTFWNTLATYKTQMQSLIQKGYTGEGFWGRGRNLSGSSNQVMVQDFLPLQICGGTYKRFRKAKKQIKARMRSIPKRFAEAGEGVTIGTDVEKRLKLTGGKMIKGKPRVAQSKRGNELRYNAALARLAASSTVSNKIEVPHSKLAEDGDLIIIDDFDKDDFELQDLAESDESRQKLKEEWKNDFLMFKPIESSSKGKESAMKHSSDVIVID